MNGNENKIEIFAPFGAAFELMKKILFQPFDFQKWCVIGFAAFLTHLSGGGGGGFNFNNKIWRHGDWDFHSVTHQAVDKSEQIPMWVFPLIIFGAVIVLAIVAVLMWIGSRGRFIFTDCIVRNRGAIAEPWREFRREGNSFFLFSLIVALAVIAVIALAFVPVLLPFIQGWAGDAAAFSLSIGLVFVIGVIVFIAVAWSLISQLMVPVMYRQRCRAVEAFRQVIALILRHPGPIVLYLLFLFVLGIAAAMIACLSACVTCCITAIPYVGTVILLPIYVLLAAFALIFLRQFGPEFDVWAAAEAQESPPVEPTPPPTAPPSLPTV